MSLLDFLTVVSILCDNAIEASVEACQPHVSIAFFKNGAQETFIIENSIKEEGIDISEIFSFGAKYHLPRSRFSSGTYCNTYRMKKK
ncbi:histidine kinase [Streptococcus pneumoniae]|nr:histidine kinase [Streptococcus pneumoniae]